MINQRPTTTKITPLKRLIFWVLDRNGPIKLWRAMLMIVARKNIKMTMVRAAAANAVMATNSPLVISAYPARPARIGPVQPKPARM
jgi:hypothetical protein